jgi:methane monooxygenase component A gamma chain
MSDVSQLAEEKKLRQEWQGKIEQVGSLTDLTDLLVDFRKNSRPPKYRGGDFRWIEAKIEERLAKLKGEQWEPADMMTKTTRGENLAELKEKYLGQIHHTKDFKALEQIVDDFREQYRPPIMPVDEFLTIERELCEVLTKVRGERWWEMSQQELRAYRGAAIIKEKNEQPHTLMALYPVPADKDAFEREYVNEHLSLARKLPAKAMQTEVVTGMLTGDVAPYHRIAELHFEDLQSLQKCAQTPEAKAALEHAVKISSGGKPHFLVLESDLAIDEEPGKEGPSVKLLVCFLHPKEKDAFETAYFSEILPETLKLPARRFKGYKVVATADGADCPLHRILVFCFDSQADLENCMTSTSGKALTDILMRTPTPPYLLIAAEG